MTSTRNADQLFSEGLQRHLKGDIKAAISIAPKSLLAK